MDRTLRVNEIRKPYPRQELSLVFAMSSFILWDFQLGIPSSFRLLVSTSFTRVSRLDFDLSFF